MPELPEVESVRRQLAPELNGRGIVAAWRDPYPSARMGELEGAVGARIAAVLRRGKFLILPLADRRTGADRELILHLGMSGSLQLASPATRAVDHLRVRLTLDDGRQLWFRDPRRFGRATLVAAGEYAARVPTLAVLGPEPLTDAFTPAGLAAALGGSRAPVKARILDQRVVAGVGNIYADEALWRAGIHPATRRVGRVRATRLHAALVEVLTAAIEREGTTFRDYRMVNGASGRYAAFLDVYGKAGTPCRRCGRVLARTTVAQRGTTYCPRCQRH